MKTMKNRALIYWAYLPEKWKMTKESVPKKDSMIQILVRIFIATPFFLFVFLPIFGTVYYGIIVPAKFFYGLGNRLPKCLFEWLISDVEIAP